ncbi:MAG: hypothetical protein HY036_00990 [Nitrospirae bacterium]|nr:hypothetical protein [Nitrospirota bacterium]
MTDLVEKRILVKSGAGFFGSHLCDKLLVKGWFTGTNQNQPPFLILKS